MLIARAAVCFSDPLGGIAAASNRLLDGSTWQQWGGPGFVDTRSSAMGLNEVIKEAEGIW